MAMILRCDDDDDDDDEDDDDDVDDDTDVDDDNDDDDTPMKKDRQGHYIVILSLAFIEHSLIIHWADRNYTKFHNMSMW